MFKHSGSIDKNAVVFKFNPRDGINAETRVRRPKRKILFQIQINDRFAHIRNNGGNGVQIGGNDPRPRCRNARDVIRAPRQPFAIIGKNGNGDALRPRRR